MVRKILFVKENRPFRPHKLDFLAVFSPYLKDIHTLVVLPSKNAEKKLANVFFGRHFVGGRSADSNAYSGGVCGLGNAHGTSDESLKCALKDSVEKNGFLNR